ncbi:MAG: winged helix-turn-helix transcriptional regulator [Dehalococcoidia bacterium]
MESSRSRILQILQRSNRATVDHLSQHLGLASATVRRHLDILQRDQQVAFTPVKKKTGRPENTYFLTEEGQETLPKDYDRFLKLLIEELSSLSKDEVASHSGKEVLLLLFSRIATRIAAENKPNPGDSFPERVAGVVTVLEREKFEPELEQVDGSYRIHIHNCPLRSVALENNSICAYDTLLLSTLMGPDAVVEECDVKPDSDCCHLVRPTAPQA